MPKLMTLFFALASLLSSFFAHADTAFTQRKDVQQFIGFMVKTHGFNRKQLTQVMSQVTIQPQIIESMNKPYEKKTWDVYKDLFLTAERVQGGMAFWKANEKNLARAEKRYGVPANIIVAIIGVETLYGKRQGNYRVLDALSTLAFDYPSRAPFFTKELSEYLLLCREHKVEPTQYMGSYAGAMGKPQFMPSSYRFYAADFDGNAKKDLMNDDAAVIASVANYFHKHGWKQHHGVAQPATITKNHLKGIDTARKSATYSARQLAAAGVKPMTAAMNQPEKAGLIELVTKSGPEYWMTYPNFYVITRYNSSPQYALVVYLLSQQLKNQWALASAQSRAYAYA